MKIISWNVNGIRAILNKGFLEFVKKENPDILCLQEVKANKEQVEIVLEDYPFHYWNSAEKKGYSGTAIFSKIEPLSVLIDKGINISEGRVVALEFEKFLLVNAYVPNSKRGLARLEFRKKWDVSFKDFLVKLSKKKEVILCGDLNVAHTEIDLANPRENYNVVAGYTQTEIDGFSALLSAGFVDSFREFDKSPGKYTYCGQWNNLRQRNIGWRIDYFITSKNFMKKIKRSYILAHVFGSDHCPIALEIADKDL